MSNQVPRYSEGINPGFKELSPIDLIVPIETEEQQKQRNQLIIAIFSEYDRLRLNTEQQDYLQHQRGVPNLEESSCFELKLYSDWLITLVRK